MFNWYFFYFLTANSDKTLKYVNFVVIEPSAKYLITHGEFFFTVDKINLRQASLIK